MGVDLRKIVKFVGKLLRMKIILKKIKRILIYSKKCLVFLFGILMKKCMLTFCYKNNKHTQKQVFFKLALKNNAPFLSWIFSSPLLLVSASSSNPSLLFIPHQIFITAVKWYENEPSKLGQNCSFAGHLVSTGHVSQQKFNRPDYFEFVRRHFCGYFGLAAANDHNDTRAGFRFRSLPFWLVFRGISLKDVWFSCVISAELCWLQKSSTVYFRIALESILLFGSHVLFFDILQDGMLLFVWL